MSESCPGQSCDCDPIWPTQFIPDTGGGNNCGLPDIVFDPPDGSFVLFPTLVVLTIDTSGAVIHYTTDGSTPTSDSPVYSAPVEVSEGETIKAVAVRGDCTTDVQSATYETNDSVEFAFKCDRVNKVGPWGVFTPSGTADYVWRLDFSLEESTEIERIEIFQTRADGTWDSGQAWSTDSPIYPFINDPTRPFGVYPLGISDDGGTTLMFSDYQSSLGTFTAGTYNWLLYGQPEASLSGYFKIIVYYGDDTTLTTIIPTNVCE